MKNASCWAVFLLCIVSASAGRAQSFGEVAFNGTDGSRPGVMTLVQGTDGTLFGVTVSGGAYDEGTVFNVDQKGVLTTLYSFCLEANCTDGSEPSGGLAFATDGNLYGTTFDGGTGPCNDPYGVGCGTVFKLTPQGTLTTLHSFQGIDGSRPLAGLIQAADGDLYGATSSDGPFGNYGTIFKVTLNGQFATVYSFCPQGPACSDGANPYSSLIQASDGSLYGTTNGGGTAWAGTIFKLTTSGKLTTLHSFDGRDGGGQQSGVIEAADGNLYGTSADGGYERYGTIYKSTTAGAVTVIYTFDGNSVGPSGGLIQATDGNFYGLTTGGYIDLSSRAHPLDPYVYGTAFSITPNGTLTTLHTFDYRSGRGFVPVGGLIQATNGALYGTTAQGGTADDGTVFRLSVGLGPYVSFLRGAAKVNQHFGILGQGFAGSTAISLNGTPAQFSVKSNTFIEAIVPFGATTGYVTATTPNGMLISNKPFVVIP